MAGGCRECQTCTKPALLRWIQWWLVATMYVLTIGIAFVMKRGLIRHCPQCKHILSNHDRRADGSFMD